MKTTCKVFMLSAFLAVCCFGQSLYAQTYATPELKATVEKEDAEKAARLGIVPVVVSPPVERTATRPPFDYNLMKGCYRLQKVEAIDHSGKHTEKEMKVFRDEAQREFEARDWAVNMESAAIYFVRKNDPTNYRVINFKQDGNYLLETGCTSCQDTRFEVIENTSTQLVLEIKPQDEGQYFMYRFTFDK